RNPPPSEPPVEKESRRPDLFAAVRIDVDVVDLPRALRAFFGVRHEREADRGLSVALEDAVHRSEELERVAQCPGGAARQILQFLGAGVALVVGEVEKDLELRVLDTLIQER